MKIEYRDIADVTPYDHNPRIRTEEAVRKVADSLRAFGWRQAIVVDKQGVIIAGHTRYEAAKLLGLDKVPIHVADLSELDARRYRIADNRVAEETSWHRETTRA